MRRRFSYFSAALISCVLALVFSSPFISRTVKAVPKMDACDECVGQVQKTLDDCEAQNGGPSQFCYDQYNQGIVHCYATVCEQ
jgi:hypothetical protein